MLDRIGQNFLAQLLSTALSVADRLVVVGLLVRSWGADIFADWAVLFATAGLVSMFEFGHNIYVGNALQKANAANDATGFQRVLSVAMWCGFALFAALVTCGGAIVFLGGTVDRLGLKALSPTSAYVVLALLGLCLISRAARGAFSQTYRGRGIYAVGTLVNLVPTAATMVGLVIAVLLGASPVAVAATYFLSEIVFGWGLMAFDLKQRFPELDFWPRLPLRGELITIVQHLKWFSLHVITPQAWLHAPVLLLNTVGTSGAQLATFVLLRTLTGLSRQLSTMLSLSGSVELVDSYHRDGSRQVTERLAALGMFMSVSSAAIAAMLLAFGDVFLTAWTGRNDLFDPALLGWLLAALMLFVPTIPIKSLLSLANAPKPVALANIAQLAIGLPALALLAPVFGASGGAAGLALGEFAGGFVVLPLLASQALPLDYPRYLTKVGSASLATFAWCTLITWAATTMIHPVTALGLITSVSAVTLLGALPALWLASPPGLRRRLVNAASRLRVRPVRAASRF